MFDITEKDRVKIVRAWQWLLQQPNFHKARELNKTMTGSPEDFLKQVMVIRTYAKWFETDLLSDEMQTKFIHDSIVMKEAKKFSK